jgi:hypothetical protein
LTPLRKKSAAYHDGTMNNHNELICNVLTYINSTSGANEFAIAKKFFAGRVLQSHSLCQYLLWSNIIVPGPNFGYVLSPMAKEAYSAALAILDSTDVDVSDL